MKTRGKIVCGGILMAPLCIVIGLEILRQILTNVMYYGMLIVVAIVIIAFMYGLYMVTEGLKGEQ